MIWVSHGLARGGRVQGTPAVSLGSLDLAGRSLSSPQQENEEVGSEGSWPKVTLFLIGPENDSERLRSPLCSHKSPCKGGRRGC